jgi:preprotein translocase subunit SecE
MAKKSKFWSSSQKELTKTEQKQRSAALRTTVIIFAFIAIFVAIGAGLMFLERYIKGKLNLSEKTIPIQLVDFPDWGDTELKQKIISTAGKSPNDFKLTEDAAIRIGENLVTLAWLYDVKVQVSNNAITVSAKYRKPVGLVTDHDLQFYIDSEIVVLDYVPIRKLPVVEITGVPGHLLTWRNVGTKWPRDDVAAAVELLVLLGRMDSEVVPNKPLLAEIKSIDMSNFNGRRSPSQPHIVLYAKDGTEIKWGAKKGEWQRHLEAKDEEKLTLLYNTYQELGTVQLRAAQKGSFIDLTRSQTLSLPIDRY